MKKILVKLLVKRSKCKISLKTNELEIDILTDKEDIERRQTEFKEKTEALIKNLEVDET